MQWGLLQKKSQHWFKSSSIDARSKSSGPEIHEEAKNLLPGKN